MTAETAEFGLTVEQLEMLLRAISPNRVREHKGNAHLEAWDIRKWLTRIFGFGGWKDEILSCDCIHSVTTPVVENGKENPLKHRCTAVYKVLMRLTVKDRWGNVIGEWEDGAVGEGINQVSVGDAHDLALKAAISQALKRCAVNLGDQFGLSLYNKGSVEPVVVRTLGHAVLAAEALDPAQDAAVVGGELDEQHEGTEPPRQEIDLEAYWSTDEGRKRLTALHALMGQKFGPMDDERRHAGFTKFTGRTVTSAKQLTPDEVDRLSVALRKEPDFQPAGESQVPPSEQAAPPQQSREQYSAELESRLLARINGVASVEQLDEAWSAVQDNTHLGALTPEQEKRLTAAMNARESQLKARVPA